MMASLHRVAAANAKEYKLNFDKQAAEGNVRKPFEKEETKVLPLTKGKKLTAFVSLTKTCTSVVLKESKVMSCRQKIHFQGRVQKPQAHTNFCWVAPPPLGLHGQDFLKKLAEIS